MAHEIWSNDNLLSVRQPTWHGLGEILPDYVTREEAQQIAHPWEPISEPVFLSEPGFDDDGTGFGPRPVTQYTEASGFKAIRRSDDATLLGIVSDTYEPVSNNEMWDIAETLQGEASDVKIETAGSLQGGRKVWALVRLAEPIEISGDPNGATIPYFSLQNSHNGSGAFRGQATLTRIVCANTAQAADMDAKARGTEFAFSHTKNVRDRIEEARQALAGWRHSIEEWKNLTDHMLNIHVEAADVQDFLERWIPEPPPATASERVLRNVEQAREEWRNAYTSATCEGIQGTAHGLLQASIEYTEFYRNARTPESRFKRSFLDRNQVVQSAQKLIMEVAR